MAGGPSSSPTLTTVVNSESPWPFLPDDLVRLISSRLLAGDLLDYVRFRAVCHPWRSGTASPLGHGVFDPRFHPRSWIMLPEGNALYPGHPNLQGYVRFFNLETGALVRAHIPLLSDDHCVLDSYRGLLVLQRDHDTVIRLLHPFTGDVLDLPPLSALLPHMDPEFPCGRSPAKKELVFFRQISTAATFVDGVVTVMLAFKSLFRVVVATSQDRHWTVPMWWYQIPRPLLSSSQGKTFVLNRKGLVEKTLLIHQIDTPLPNQALQPPKLIATCTPDKLREPLYLVECDDEILVVGRDNMSPPNILVFKLADVVMGIYIPVTSIGDNAIFIQDMALCVSTKALPTVMSGTIICTFNHEPAQYHLSSGAWLPPMDQSSFLRMEEQGPCTLVQHIVTCCSRAHWNKGLLVARKKYTAGWPFWPWLRWPIAVDLRRGA